MTRFRSGLMACAVAVAVRLAAPAAADVPLTPPPRPDSSTFFPRFTLLELQYPQGVAASVGLWAWLPGGGRYRQGLVADAELGLSGATLTLGPGMSTAPDTDYEKIWSLGIQGVLHRTWPWWSPWLPTSATYAGAEIFGQFFAFRCSAGALWSMGNGDKPSHTLIGGCGLGLP